MHTESSGLQADGSRRVERAIVLVLLSEDDGERSWSRRQLCEGMAMREDELSQALDGLLRAGVLLQERDRVWPSPATRRLDALGLIGV